MKHDAHGDRVVPDGQQDLIQVFSLPDSAPSLDYVLQLSMQGLLLITFMFQRLSAHDELVRAGQILSVQRSLSCASIYGPLMQQL